MDDTMEIVLPPLGDLDPLDLLSPGDGSAMVVRQNATPTVAMSSQRVSVHGASEFISRTWLMVNDSPEELIFWSADGSRIGVKNAERLAQTVLPRYFNHSHFASWVRALNANAFRKVAPGQWEHPYFVRDKPELLRKVCRKPTSRRNTTKDATKQRGSSLTSALPGSTALVELSNGGVPIVTAANLADERRKLRWLEEQVGKLEGDLRAVRHEAFSQRLAVVQAAQLVVSMLPSRTPRAARERRGPATPLLLQEKAPLALTFTPPTGHAAVAQPSAPSPPRAETRAMRATPLCRELSYADAAQLPPSPCAVQRHLSLADLAGALDELTENDLNDLNTLSAEDLAELVHDTHADPAVPPSAAALDGSSSLRQPLPAAMPYVAPAQPTLPLPPAPSNALHEALVGAPPIPSPGVSPGRPTLSAEQTEHLARLVDYYFSRLTVAADRALAAPPAPAQPVVEMLA